MKAIILIFLFYLSFSIRFNKFKDLDRSPATLLKLVDKINDPHEFEEIVAQMNTIVLFYMTWCGYWWLNNKQTSQTNFKSTKNLRSVARLGDTQG